MKKQEKVLYGVIILAVVAVLFMMMFLWVSDRWGRGTMNLGFVDPTVHGNVLTTGVVVTQSVEDKVAAVDLTVVFDPEKLELVDFRPGGALVSPTILQRKAVKGEGSLRLAMFTMDPKVLMALEDVLMVLEFEVVEGVSLDRVKLEFADDGCHIATDGTGNVCGRTKDLKFKLSGEGW